LCYKGFYISISFEFLAALNAMVADESGVAWGEVRLPCEMQELLQ
jgi:hypothetical protein